MKRFYLKYDISVGELILDPSRKRATINELLVVPNRITQTQGKTLKKRLETRQLIKGRKLFVPEVEEEFHKLFSVCKTCGFVTDRNRINKAWSGECKSCFRETQEARKRENQANRDYIRQIRKYKLHLKTLQGRIDSVPAPLIVSNINFEMKKQGKKWKDLADYLELSQPKLNEILGGKTIRKEYLLLVCEFLFVPVEKLLKRQRGFKIPYKDGVPEFWLEAGFRIRNYDDNLKNRKV